MPHVNKKSQAKKSNFDETALSYFTLKLEKIACQKITLFFIHFIVPRQQSRHFNLAAKIMKMC